ncbi:MAG: transglutaminase domain-containing protein [Candidatus Omnitrophica bacterium]|nr:transglutaminase domain-containing protein [Candidatus Omnitrophota bacterium]
MRPRRRILWTSLFAALALAGLWGVASSPATTRQGVNFEVSAKRMPLYVKTIDFLHRHSHYQLLANEITRGLRSDRERVLAVFEWTRRHIRHTPKGWPVVDDHVLDIIIRGHGLDDQMADVFTTLTTYAGVPAFWWPGSVVVSFARVDGRWRMFDVANGLIFTDAQGQLADVHELLDEPSLIDAAAGGLTAGGQVYAEYVRKRLGSFEVPAVLRAEQQMPLPRLTCEIRSAVQHLWAAQDHP